MKTHESQGKLDLFDHVDDFIYDMHVSQTLKSFQMKFDEMLYHNYQKSRNTISNDASLSESDRQAQLDSLDRNYVLGVMDPDLRQDFTILKAHLQHLRVRHRIMRTIEKFDERVRDVLINSIAVVFTKARPSKYEQKIIGETVQTDSLLYSNAAMRKTIDRIAGGFVYPRHIIFMNVINMSAGKGIGGSLSHEIAHLLSDDVDNINLTGEDKSILIYRNVLNQPPSTAILTKEMLANLPQMYFVSQ